MDSSQSVLFNPRNSKLCKNNNNKKKQIGLCLWLTIKNIVPDHLHTFWKCLQATFFLGSEALAVEGVICNLPVSCPLYALRM